MKPIKPTVSFNFTEAVGQIFLTSGGKDFAKRLIVSVTAIYFITMLIALPIIAPQYLTLLDLNWTSIQFSLNNEPITPEHTQALFSVFAKLAPGYILLMVGLWFATAAGEAALYRKVFHETEYARFPLRFGKAELRIIFAQLSVFLIWFLAYFLGFVVIMFATMAIGAINQALGMIVLAITFICLLYLLAVIPMRLAVASAVSTWRGEFTVTSVWSMNKHRFWQLLGAYIIVMIGGYIAVILSSGIGGTVLVGDSSVLPAMMGMGDSLPSEVFSSIQDRLRNPIIVLLIVFSILLYALAMACMYMSLAGIAAYATRWYFAEPDSNQLT